MNRGVVFFLPVVLFAATPRDELRFCIYGDPKTFDALRASEQNAETIRYLTGGVLLRVNRVTDRPEAELAESWKLSPDGRSISFHLRSGLKFSDGTPLTAAEVARTFNMALDPKQAFPVGDAFRSPGAVEVKVDSTRDITISYVQPKPRLENLFDTLSIVPPNPGKLPASAGPFFVSEYKPGESILLRRNPNYWKKGKPYLDSIRVDIQRNREIEMTRFLRGETHLILRVDPENFARLSREKPAAARNLGASLDSELIWFNQVPSAGVPEWKRKWFASATFRHAISASIRRDDLARIAFRGYAHPAIGPVSPSNRFWFNTALKAPPYDSKSALSSLAKEGFTLRDGILHDRNGHEVEFSLITNSGNRAREAEAAAVQDDLKQIGVRVNIATLDFPSLVERITKTNQYEACLLGFSNVEVDPMEHMDVWLSSGERHAWWPLQKSPATPWEAHIDQLELAQASQPDPALRKKAFDEVQRIALEQEPIIFLLNPDYLTAVSPLLHGVQPVTAPPQILWNIESLRLE